MFSRLSLKDLFKRKVELGGQFFFKQNNNCHAFSLSHKVCRFFSTSFLLCKLTVVVIQHVHVGGPEYNISHTVIPNNHNPQYYIIIF